MRYIKTSYYYYYYYYYNYYSCLDRKRAVEIGQALIEQHFGRHVKNSNDLEFEDSDKIYRLIEDDTATALNQGMSSLCEPRRGKTAIEEGL